MLIRAVLVGSVELGQREERWTESRHRVLSGTWSTGPVGYVEHTAVVELARDGDTPLTVTALQEQLGVMRLSAKAATAPVETTEPAEEPPDLASKNATLGLEWW